MTENLSVIVERLKRLINNAIVGPRGLTDSELREFADIFDEEAEALRMLLE